MIDTKRQQNPFIRDRFPIHNCSWLARVRILHYQRRRDRRTDDLSQLLAFDRTQCSSFGLLNFANGVVNQFADLSILAKYLVLTLVERTAPNVANKWHPF